MSTPTSLPHPAWAQFLGGAPAIYDTTSDSTQPHHQLAEPAPGYSASGPPDPEHPCTWPQEPPPGWDPAGHAAGEADASCRTADGFTHDADDLLCLTVDNENALVSNLSAVTTALLASAQANLGLAYEMRAMRYEIINSGGFSAVADAISFLRDAVDDNARQTADVAATVNSAGTAVSDAISLLTDAVAENGKHTSGELRGVAEAVSPISYELNRVNHDLAMRRGEE